MKLTGIILLLLSVSGLIISLDGQPAEGYEWRARVFRGAMVLLFVFALELYGRGLKREIVAEFGLRPSGSNG